MLEKTMTTEELFNKIRGILNEKGKLTDILDYGLAAYTGHFSLWPVYR